MHYHEIIALEVGADFARAVHAVQGMAHPRYASAKSIKLPPNPEERRRLLSSFVQKNNWSGLPCVLGLSEDATIVRTFRRRSGARHSSDVMMDEEMGDLRELAGGATIAAHVEQPPVRKQRRILAAVGKMDTIHREIMTAAEAGLDVTEAVPASVAHVRGIIRFLPARIRWWGNIHVEKNGTRFTLSHGPSIVFSRYIPIGAWAISRETGHAHAIERWTGEMAESMRMAERYMTDTDTGAQVMVISGETICAEELQSEIAEAVRTETTTADKFKKARRFPFSIAYLTCVGLIEQAMKSPRRRLSLQPPPMRQRAALRRQKAFWVLIGLTVCAALALLILNEWLYMKRTRSALHVLGSRIETLSEINREMDTLANEIRRIREQSRPFVSAMHNVRMVRHVLRLIAEAKTADDWITYFGDRDAYFSGITAAQSDSYNGFDRLIVEGYTPHHDLSSVRAAIEVIETQPGIMQVDLLGDDQIRNDTARDERWRETGCRLFALEITLATP